MFFSYKIKDVTPSKTSMISDLASKLKREGKEIISMAAGELDLSPEKNIKSKAIEVIKNGNTKYAPVSGLEELKEAISRKLMDENSLSYPTDHIIVSNGGKQVIYNALVSTINPGDEVIIISPYWVSYPEMVKLCGGVPKILKSDRESNYQINVEKLKKIISKKTKWLIINSPNNPTGTVYSPETLRKIAEILTEHSKIWVLSDEIYEKLNFIHHSPRNIVNIQKALKKRVLLVNGFSKSYCMTGWRLGYGAGPKRLIRSMLKVQSQSTSAANTIAQFAGVDALELSDSSFSDLLTILKRRQKIMLKEIQKINGLLTNRPEGAFYIFPSINFFIGKKLMDGTVIKDDLVFCKELLKRKNIAVVPGSSFGEKNCIRLSYALKAKDIILACNKMKEFCDSIE
ncbi:MAG: aspartate aminotransferase [Rhodobacteraceae bacterium]|nr:MAG: aspartate aminotransferase [Paracoccaceae bacterium]